MDTTFLPVLDLPSIMMTFLRAKTTSFLVKSSVCLALCGIAGFASRPAEAKPGDLDPTFDVDGRVTTNIRRRAGGMQVVRVKRQGNGKILVAGMAGPMLDMAACFRFNADGTIDNTYGNLGRATTTFGKLPVGWVGDMAIDPFGRAVLVGRVGDSRYDSQAAAIRFTTQGQLDSTFGIGGIQPLPEVENYGSAFAVAIQPDGKIVAGGNKFMSESAWICRLNLNGSLDAGFATQGVFRTTLGTQPLIEHLAIAGDGSIVASAMSSSIHAFNFIRLTPAGALDKTFGTGGYARHALGRYCSVNGMSLFGDGRIVFGGMVGDEDPNSTSKMAIVQLQADGKLDPKFSGDGMLLFERPEMVMLSSFSRASDGKLVMSGQDWTRGTVLRFLPDGQVDTTFNGRGIQRLSGVPAAYIRDHVVSPTGEVIVASESSGDYQAIVRRIQPSGAVDSGFGVSGKATNGFESVDGAYGVIVQKNGKVLIVGWSDRAPIVARYLANGALDSAFGVGGLVHLFPNTSAVMYRIRLQADGKILVLGQIMNTGYVYGVAIVRLLPDGTLDGTFGTGGIASYHFERDAHPSDFALQPDGKIVVAATVTGTAEEVGRLAVLRFMLDGRLDDTFDRDGVLNYLTAEQAWPSSIAVQGNGKILVGGSFSDPAGMEVLRLTPTGAPDTAWGVGGLKHVPLATPMAPRSSSQVAMGPDGNILVSVSDYNGRGAIAKLQPSGALLTSFGKSGKLEFIVSGLHGFGRPVIGSRGNISFSATHYDTNFEPDFGVLHITPGGQLDTNFGEGGLVRTDFHGGQDYVHAIALDPNGKLVVAGNTVLNGFGDIAIARYLLQNSGAVTSGISGSGQSF